MFANRRVLGHLALGLTLFGAQACEQSSSSDLVRSDVPAGEAGFEQTSFPLIAQGCVVNGTTQQVTFTMGANESLYMFKRAADGQVVANAVLSTNANAECAFPTNYRVIVGNTATTNTHKVLFDFVGGTFGMATVAATGTGTNPGPNLVVNLSGTGNTVKIRGTSNWEVYTFGTITGSPSTSYGSFNVGTATAAPTAARTFPDLSMVGVQNLAVATGAGNDVITGQGGAPIGASSVALDGTIGFDVYGGDGNDSITSGAASSVGVSNTLYGQNGDDMFIQQAAKAHDNISGSDTGGAADSDTVDYSSRSMPVSVTLGDDLLIGVTSSGSVACVNKASTMDHDRVTVNDGTHTAVTYEFQKTAVAASSGSILTDVAANYANNETFTLDDGVHTPIVFEYHQGAGFTATPGDTTIDITGATTADDVATATYTAIAAAAGPTFTITATAPTAGMPTIVLSNPAGYNTTIATAGGTGNMVTSFTGGSSFALTTMGNIPVNISSGSVVTALDVCTALWTAMSGTIPVNTSTTLNTGASSVIIAITPAAFKPAGASITKGAGSMTVNDFSAGTANGANDGESGETDSIANTIENIVGGSGADVLDASKSTLSTHILVGMLGNDTLIGSNLADTLWGGVGDDILQGGGGIDVLNGGDGNDSMQGGAGNDTLDGGGLNCQVIPATQPPTGQASVPATTSCTTAASAKSAVAGVNPGVNTLDYSDRSVAVTADLTNLGSSAMVTGAVGEKDVVAFASGTTGPYSVQYLRGGSAADTLTGDGLANIIWGGGGDDIINGGGGNDAIYGEAGNDTIHGDSSTALPTGQVAGDDFISGGPGMNTLFGDNGNDLIDNTAGTAMGSIDCGQGDSDVAMSSAFSDTLTACEL